MKKFYLLIAMFCFFLSSFGQTTVVLYSGGSLPLADSVTGYVSSLGPTYGKHTDTITAAGTFGIGYALFDFASIPTTATITSVRVGFTVDSYAVIGTAAVSAYKIGGYAGDLSAVTPASTLFTDASSSTTLYTNAWDTTGNQILPTTPAAQTFVQSRLGSFGTLTFSNTSTGFGAVLYSFAGEHSPADTTSGPHTPFLIITYTSSCPSISGPDSVCVGSLDTLIDTASGGTWFSSNSSIATVVSSFTGGCIIRGISPGIDTIKYVTTGCTAIYLITVNAYPTTISPSTGVTLCVGSMTDYASGPMTGTIGTWSSSNTTVATLGSSPFIYAHIWGASDGVANISYTLHGCSVSRPITVVGPVAISPDSVAICTGSSTTLIDTSSGGTWSTTAAFATVSGGIVTGLSVGIDTIKYTVGSCSAKAIVTVSTGAGTISPAGPSSVCIGGTVSLSDATGGGIWSSSNNAIASVVGGVVTGGSVGTAIISYTIGSCSSITTVNVTSGPAAISPSSASVCIGNNVTFTDATSGGTWSSSTGSASLVSAGVFIGTSVGTTTISYNISGCLATATLNVNSAPSPISPSSPSVCTGSNITLTDATSGGTWTSSNAAVASISSGVLYGITAGSATVTYAIGTCSVTTTITVLNSPADISPATATICLGGTTLLTDATGGGAWTSSNTAIASVISGTVTGVSIGSATITYTSGSCYKTASVNVSAGPGAITPSGLLSICTGYTTTLSDASGGGTWSTSSSALATITSGGVLRGVGAGIVIVTYSVGSCIVTKSVTITAGPSAISPSTLSLCIGTSGLMTDATPSGAWLSSNTAVATVAGGLVFGAGVGTATISYNVGTCAALATVSVNSSPAAITSSGSSVCVGTPITLTDGTSGGTWSSSATGVATVSSSGIVSSLSTGTATISYAIGTCVATTIITVNTSPSPIIPGTATVCQGDSTALTDATGFGAWTSSATTVATVGISGKVYGVSAGTATISYTSGTCSTTATVTVNPLPSAGAIIGTTSLCTGAGATLFTPTVGGGTWSASNSNAIVDVSGNVTPITAGTDIISYGVSNSCGTVYTTLPITIIQTPTAGTIIGSPTICVGSAFSFTDPTATTGGAWTEVTGNTSVSFTGLVTGLSNGTDVINYTITNSCGTATTSYNVTVNPVPAVFAITGTATSVCAGATTTLSDATIGGTWSSINGTATVSASGVVTGISNGIDTIIYTVSNSCGTVTANYPITIYGVPTGGTISGSSSVCAGSTITLTSSFPGGSWSSSNANATVIPTSGAVSGVLPGKDTITYTLVTACWVGTTTKVVTIDPSPGSGGISGPISVCVGTAITLSDIYPGGTWGTTNGHAAVGASGIVTGIFAGVDTILYTLINSCGTDVASYPVTVTLTASAGTISGPSDVCLGSMITLSESLPGGTWSASNAHATISGGIVTGISTGVDNISYTLVSSCGTAVAVLPVTISVFPIAGIISGATTVCTSASTSMTETIAGGTWSSGDLSIATISPTGIVYGVAVGTDTISYSITNACGTVGTFKIMTIGTPPNPGIISGAGAVCVGGTLPLTDPIAGGSWSASNTDATVVSGIVTGVSAGTLNISYSVTNSCGTSSAIAPITVEAFPSGGSISGLSNVCVGSAITLLGSIPGGIWNASNGNASILAPGIISGITVGIDTIFYSVTNICGTAVANKIITVNPIPVVPAIAGPTAICVGSISGLTDPLSSGNWTSANPSVAAIDFVTGTLTGASAGTTTISYTVTNSFGCPNTVTYPDTVLVIPVISAITGITHQCIGGSSLLSNATTGGTWTSSNTAIATTDALGNVYGVTSGIVTISYMVTNICGTTTMTVADTISALPSVAPIMGTASGCIATNATYTDATTGGFWSSSNAIVATINASTGGMTGVAAGAATISYTVTNAYGCSTYTTSLLTINPSPVVSAITGTTNECIGGISTLSDATAGGTWSSSSSSIATVDTILGSVKGINAGILTITYSILGGTGCYGYATTLDTVNAISGTTPITGTHIVCIAGTTTLANATSGGTWSSANTLIASINSATGVVSGISMGNVLISYTVTGGTCGSYSDTVTLSVKSLPTVSPISGTSATICSGSTTSLTDVTTGGTWSSNNTAIATVGATSGIVYGISTGVVSISYTVTNTSGCSNATGFLLNFGGSIGSATITPADSVTICHSSPIDLVVSTSVAGLTYQWYKNGTIISGATNNSFSAATAGIYDAIINNGTCQETLASTTVNPAITPVITFIPPHTLSIAGSFTSYQWYLNGTAIAGATSNTYTEDTNGTYTVDVTETTGCADTSIAYIMSGWGTSVSNINNYNNIKVYPNPASTYLYIDAPIDVTCTILSIDGRIIVAKNNSKEINLSAFNVGIYLIQIYDKNDNLIKVERFTKVN